MDTIRNLGNVCPQCGGQKLSFQIGFVTGTSM